MRLPRWVQLGLAIGAGLGAGGCGSDCNAEGCSPHITVTANVPDIGSARWTLTVCLNGHCESDEITSAIPGFGFGLGGWTLQPGDAGGSLLTVDGNTQTPKDGDHWSVDVVDEQGNTIVHWARAVTYQTHEQSCGATCQYASYSAN
jgi:hypothetical protein